MNIHTKKHKFIPGTFDLAFKEIITSEECKDFTCRIISGITNIDEESLKENLVVQKERLPKEFKTEKTKETDVLLSVEGTIINLEMNKELFYLGEYDKEERDRKIYNTRRNKRRQKKEKKQLLKEC